MPELIAPDVWFHASYVAAMEEFAGAYIASGFRGTSPAAATGQERYLVEVAFERYIERHGKYTLVKVEDPTWTVFHTNASGPRLVRIREDYVARRNIEPFMNAGRVVKLHGGSYYGKKRDYLLELRCAIGATPAWKAVKRVLRVGSHAGVAR